MRFSPFRIAGLTLALIAGVALFATPAAAHPGHSTDQSAPWYRYLPPGIPVPATPATH